MPLVGAILKPDRGPVTPGPSMTGHVGCSCVGQFVSRMIIRGWMSTLYILLGVYFMVERGSIRGFERSTAVPWAAPGIRRRKQQCKVRREVVVKVEQLHISGKENRFAWMGDGSSGKYALVCRLQEHESRTKMSSW